AGNVVDLCPVGALGSKDFLYKQRVWYLKTADGVCSRCSTGCSIVVDQNKDIVYRLRPRPFEPAEAKGQFICDEGRYGYHFTNSGERVLRPLVKSEGRFKLAPWVQVIPQLRDEFAAAAKANPAGVVAVLSPFLIVEEAFLLATYFKGLSKGVRLVLGPVPVIGEDDRYPKDVKGNPVEPTRFTIRAEKCPNRNGVEAVLRHFEGDVIPLANVVREPLAALWFAGGYPVKEHAEAGFPTDWQPPPLVVAQDLFPSLVTAAAKFVLPATSSFEKGGTFVNHAGLAQTFPRAVRPPVEVRSELQIAFDLLGRRGLVQPAAVRAELAAAIPTFAEKK
ncbi:MAG: molybdopterin-dependent oxidoreductase, partial [Gemmataceae bacterium]|nr:molybdopterin-dependent oxidoreductase [Gemmataceae bacterium]